MKTALLAVLAVLISSVSFGADTTATEKQKEAKRPPQTVCLSETDPSSPRHTMLKGSDTSSTEILRIDVDGDGDPDVLERWWNGKRVRWIDENDNMTTLDVQGDMSGDTLQVDRDGDGYFDGPDDLNVHWVDDNGDGRADLEVVAINPNHTQPTIASIAAHYMIFEDLDHDNVNAYIDWQTFDFPCWRYTGLGNFSPDYSGNSVFLKEHLPAWAIQDPRYNWENPFAFIDWDGDGCSEQAVRLCDNKISNGPDQPNMWHYDGIVEEAYTAFDLDNDTQKGNEFDYDLTFKFFGGKGIDYKQYHHKHPGLKAPEWALKYFRYSNYRQIDELIYVPQDKCFEEMYKAKWDKAYLTFDEDDDDHRWERVELYNPNDPYSTERAKKDSKGGLDSHVQSDTLGDRGEFDLDFSGAGKVYIGKWDKKIHLYGAEWGGWTVDYGAKFWGSSPVTGGSSPEKAKKVAEVVQYKDTNNDGFIDEITYDYDGDQKVDLKISLLDYKASDKAGIIDPAKEKWPGMHNLFLKITEDAWQDAWSLYRAAWKKGLTTPEIDDLSICSSTGEKYDHAYWLKEKIFRMLDQKLANTPEQPKLREAFFTGNIKGVVTLVESRAW